MQEIYIAGGCLWGVQEYFRYVPGVLKTTAGRANGTSTTTAGTYDGYAECVRLVYDPEVQSVAGLMRELFEIIDPYSRDRQGNDVGEKYRTGIYSLSTEHLELAHAFIDSREDSTQIMVEVLPLTNFVASDTEHQDRLLRCPDDYCHISEELMYRHKIRCDD